MSSTFLYFLWTYKAWNEIWFVLNVFQIFLFSFKTPSDMYVNPQKEAVKGNLWDDILILFFAEYYRILQQNFLLYLKYLHCILVPNPIIGFFSIRVKLRHILASESENIDNPHYLASPFRLPHLPSFNSELIFKGGTYLFEVQACLWGGTSYFWNLSCAHMMCRKWPNMTKETPL